MYVTRSPYGLGDSQQIIGAGASGAAAIGTAAIQAGSLAAGFATAGITAGVGLAVAVVFTWLNSIKASHAADTATTAIVNQLADLLQKNLDAFKAGPRTCADKQAALAAYDAGWAWLISPQACGNPSAAIQAGGAGKRCVEDRQPGGRWPWQSYYRDPIANTVPTDLSDSACNTAINSGAQASAIAALAQRTGNQSLLDYAQQTLPGSSSGGTGGGSVQALNISGLILPAALLLIAVSL